MPGAALSRGRSRLAGFFRATLTVLILSGRFVVTRFSVTRELQVGDVTALRFGIGALLLTPKEIRRRSRFSSAVWREGLPFAVLWGVFDHASADEIALQAPIRVC